MPEIQSLNTVLHSVSWLRKAKIARLLPLLWFPTTPGVLEFATQNKQRTSDILLLFLSGSIQFSSVTQSCPTLCDRLNRSTPSLPVHHQLPDFTQTHVPRVGDVIQPSHTLSSPSPPAPDPSQHQGLFQ